MVSSLTILVYKPLHNVVAKIMPFKQYQV